ncbi:hypothetical protein ABIE78_005180 [Sinorhizobium fredii]|uniref:Uncharacterized protein n=1 Tax=Sinorhizobium fredii (strain USDA 257) TaxID=1185652 RepID=I3WZK0_SINF2|nr:hypothetical protein USDA257_c04590 [Sinorhizobium fredii USDA 257]
MPDMPRAEPSLPLEFLVVEGRSIDPPNSPSSVLLHEGGQLSARSCLHPTIWKDC